ncbi:MAG: helix-turn-helix domain-containing protein [Promethearchaeota archaeon]
MPKEDLQQLVKHERSARKLKQLQAILWCYETNYYVYTSRIASKICITPSIICNWVYAWNKKGLDGLKIGEMIHIFTLGKINIKRL